jgi:hypothetical protein
MGFLDWFRSPDAARNKVAIEIDAATGCLNAACFATRRRTKTVTVYCR